MKTRTLTQITRAATVVRDGALYAARVVMASILLLFAFMVLPQAVTP